MSETASLDPASAAPAQPAPRFTQGPIMRHVAVMSATAAVGLMAIFLVDVLSLLYVSWLHSDMKIAAVGFASTILFFAMSVNIGLMIAVSALVSRALGARDRQAARRMAGSGVALTALLAALVGMGMWLFRDALLGALNASGETASLASSFLNVTLPANVFMGFGIAYSAVLRAAGDARRAMYVTLGGGIATAFIDPLLIFGLRLDVMGAAYAIVISRLVFAAIGYHGAVVVHDLVAWPRFRSTFHDAGPLAAIAAPAVLTNLATPFGNAFLASIVALYGVEAMAASAVIDRLIPLAFGGLFALSGAIGPILGQNWGAGLFPRMRRTLGDAMLLNLIYVGAMWIALMLAREQVIGLFNLHGQAADIVALFCFISGPAWICIGALFVANAVFNNLDYPLLATLFNWGRATLGTIPFAYAGAHYYGAPGAIIGVFAAGAVFGIAAGWSSWLVLGRLAASGKLPARRGKPATAA